MNRGRGHSTPRGRGRKSWQPITANSSAGHQTPVSGDTSSKGNVLGSSDRRSNSSWQAVGRGSGGGVSNHPDKVSPTDRQGQRRGWSTFGGEGYSSGGREKQCRDSSETGNGSDFSHDKRSGSSSGQLNFRDNGVSNQATENANPESKGAGESSSLCIGPSFIEHVDHLQEVSSPSQECAVRSSHSEDKGSENAENVCDNKNSESSNPIDPFDICPPKSGSVVVLKPTLFAKNREKRNDMKRSIGGRKGTVLRSGMVLLKNYLAISEQVKILRICRSHGLGPAGFCQPRFHDGGKMHLKLMCFGEFWDPETSKYTKLRPHGIKPPSLPHEFLQLVDEAIKDSHSLIAEKSKVRNVEDILPQVKPDICLVNYYATTGRLGLHQDKDEGQETLDRGIPIVSFSIGDSAEFLYGDQREAEKAEKILLESGDVLIFGGEARHIFHGVSTILPKTAPASLLEETNFLPGRINLTFRQHQ